MASSSKNAEGLLRRSLRRPWVGCIDWWHGNWEGPPERVAEGVRREGPLPSNSRTVELGTFGPDTDGWIDGRSIRRHTRRQCPGVSPPAWGGWHSTPMHSDFLVLGYANNTPYFLELSGDGQLNWHTAGKFAVVGSGGPFAEVANGLMAHYVEAAITRGAGHLGCLPDDRNNLPCFVLICSGTGSVGHC